MLQNTVLVELATDEANTYDLVVIVLTQSVPVGPYAAITLD